MQNLKGVITADIVGSTKIPIEKRDLLPKIIKNLSDELQVLSPFRLEMYRGDSFQIIIDRYEKTLLIATLLRLGLKKESASTETSLDVRISVGIGEVEYENQSVGLSDGEAFILSGRSFEKIGKRRLIAQTSNQIINDELAVHTFVIDELLAELSVRQSEVLYEWLKNPDAQQKTVAFLLGVKPSVISKSLHAARANVIQLVSKRIEVILKNYIC